MGVSGQDEGTNPFWGERSEDFPTPPMLKTPILRLFGEGAKSLGLHPYMMPSANLFAVSAGSYAHMSGYNAALTVGALAYRCAEGIIEYSKSPKRLES